MPVATSEPDSITAGETLAWTKSLPAFPATSYTLKYSIQLAGALIAITASASGSSFAVNVGADVTASYAPGVYGWTSYVEDVAGARIIIARGSITIFPSPLAALGSTHASRTLALIETAIEGRIPRGLEETTIDGQHLNRIPIETLHRLRDKYRREAAAESPRGNVRIHGIRFRNP